MIIVINILLFVCIVIAYILIAQAVCSLPFLVIGLITGSVDKFRKSVSKAKKLRYMTVLEVWFSIFFCAIYLFAHFRYQLWTNSQIYLWSSPILFLVLYLRSVFGAGFAGSSNPILRRLAGAVWLALIPIVIIVPIGVINSQLIALWSIKWGVAVGVGIVLLSTAIWGRAYPAQIERFEILDNRHKMFGEKIGTLVHIVNVIGDRGKAKDLSNLASELNIRYSNATDFLRQGKFSDAENLIIQSEIEVNQIEENLENRIKYSLKEEIRSRLEQTRADLQRLRGEFETASISREQIDELDSKIQEDILKINSLTFSTEMIAEQLEPFERTLALITDMRAGLRLRKNVGSQLDEIRREINDHQLTIDIASNLGLETDKSQLAKEQILILLDDLQNKELSSQELINIYQSLQNYLTKFRESVAIFEATIRRNWICQETDSGQFISYVPKYCRTDESKNVVLVLKKEQGVSKEINVSIGGTLLEFEANRNITMFAQADSNYVISFFNFVGKRPGRGSVVLHSDKLKGLQNKLTFSVRIIPRVIELARDSLIFAGSFGGLALLLFLGLGKNLTEYAPLAAAIGVAFSLFLFLVRFMTIAKYKQ